MILSALLFFQDSKNPPIISLTPEDFENRVVNRKDDEIWLVDFFSPGCPPCQQLAPEYRKLAKLFTEYPFVHIAEVDCSRHNWLCQKQYIQGYPTIRVFPRNGWTPA